MTTFCTSLTLKFISKQTHCTSSETKCRLDTMNTHPTKPLPPWAQHFPNMRPGLTFYSSYRIADVFNYPFLQLHFVKKRKYQNNNKRPAQKLALYSHYIRLRPSGRQPERRNEQTMYRSVMEQQSDG